MNANPKNLSGYYLVDSHKKQILSIKKHFPSGIWHKCNTFIVSKYVGNGKTVVRKFNGFRSGFYFFGYMEPDDLPFFEPDREKE